jgi:hypothetical protein
MWSVISPSVRMTRITTQVGVYRMPFRFQLPHYSHFYLREVVWIGYEKWEQNDRQVGWFVSCCVQATREFVNCVNITHQIAEEIWIITLYSVEGIKISMLYSWIRSLQKNVERSPEVNEALSLISFANNYIADWILTASSRNIKSHDQYY